MILPGIIYAYLFLVGMNYFSQSSSLFIEAIILKTGLKSWVDNLSSDLIGFFITMGSFWLWFTLLLFYFALFKFLFLLLFAPYFSYFHLKIEKERFIGKNKKILSSIMTAILLFFIVLGYIRCTDWQSNFTLFEAGAKSVPNSSRANAAIGSEYMNKAEKEVDPDLKKEYIDNSIKFYKKSIAVKIKSKFSC